MPLLRAQAAYSQQASLHVAPCGRAMDRLMHSNNRATNLHQQVDQATAQQSTLSNKTPAE
jgi:hypothetical protein